MSDKDEKLLIECLDALDRGELPEQILARYPQDAARLRPMLQTAVQLRRLSLQPTRAAQMKSKEAFLASAAALKAQSAPRPMPWWRVRRLLAPVLTLVVVALFGLGLVQASAGTLPGDTLYGVKLLVENARLAISRDPVGTEMLQQQERVQEIRRLLDVGRAADVRFSGLITAVSPNQLIIAGLLTELTPQTVLLGDPAVGLSAEVNGRTENGRLLAVTILVQGTVPPTPAPLPAETETAVPTQVTPAPAATQVTPTATPAPSIQANPTPASNMGNPSATPTPAPTVDNVNDNQVNDNHGDYDNDNNNQNDNLNDNDNDNNNDNDDDDDNRNNNDNRNDNED